MSTDLDLNIIDASLKALRDQKANAEKAVAQIDEQQLFTTPAEGSNSIAAIMKHVGGNLHSRWRDFLTTDGEKPDRGRDEEFEPENDTPESIREVWNRGWATLEATLSSLSAEDLSRTITIRAEPMSAATALQRSVAHTAHHIGQIVLLAKMMRGDEWKTLSIPKRRK